jgi:O-antigen/teichoic acid export membrane protein
VRIKAIVLLVAAFILSQESPLHAYLDPGTGSMVLQGIIAALAAGAFIVKLLYGRLKNKFTKQSTAHESRDSINS